MRRSAGVCTAVLFALNACAPARVPRPAPAQAGDADAAVLRSLASTVESLAACHTNFCRLAAARRRARELGLGGAMRSEWIDWFSLQRNLVIELPGAGDEIVYVVAHYDRTDINPLKFASLLLNDLLDPLAGLTYLSEGAVDNATGVAVALQIAAELAGRDLRRTYRVLLTGAEEGGLRGARAHVARLSAEERDRVAFAVNLDTVGMENRPNCLISSVGDPELRREAVAAAERAGYPLGQWPLPGVASGDFAPFEHTSFLTDLGRGLLFNFTGGLLPQRSWFTASWEGRVVAFSSCDLVGPDDILAGLFLLPIGRIHGPRDRAARVDLERLYEQYAIVMEFLQRLDAAD